MSVMTAHETTTHTFRRFTFAASSRYPDGQRWKTAIRRNWAKAFNVVTKQQQSVAAIERTSGNALANIVTKQIKAKSNTIEMIQIREVNKKQEQATKSNNIFQLADTSKAFNIVTTQRRNQATITESNEAENANKVFHLADTSKHNVITNPIRDQAAQAKNDKTSIAHKVFRHAEINKALNIVSRYKQGGVNKEAPRLTQIKKPPLSNKTRKG